MKLNPKTTMYYIRVVGGGWILSGKKRLEIMGEDRAKELARNFTKMTGSGHEVVRIRGELPVFLATPTDSV